MTPGPDLREAARRVIEHHRHGYWSSDAFDALEAALDKTATPSPGPDLDEGSAWSEGYAEGWNDATLRPPSPGPDLDVDRLARAIAAVPATGTKYPERLAAEYARLASNG